MLRGLDKLVLDHTLFSNTEMSYICPKHHRFVSSQFIGMQQLQLTQFYDAINAISKLNKYLYSCINLTRIFHIKNNKTVRKKLIFS